jgi:photosystem II stability/assembly factor-like uncharacterized protein
MSIRTIVCGLLATASLGLPASAYAAESSRAPVNATLGSYDRHAEWSWQPVAIGAGGWMRGMVLHPRDSRIRYARADTWGAYRWDNTNSRWIQMVTAATIPATAQVAASNDLTSRYNVTAAPNATGVDSIAIDPNNTTRVFIAMAISPPPDLTGNIPRNGNVYYSTNSGRTFRPSTGLTLPSRANPGCYGDELGSNNFAGERLRVDPANSRVLYLGSQYNGLFVSSDAGVSFTAVSAPGLPGTCQAIVNVVPDSRQLIRRTINGVALNVSRVLYLVTDAAAGASVFRSEDGGASWADIGIGISGFRAGAMGGSQIDSTGAFWITASDRVWRYTAGAWREFNPPRAGNSIAIDPADPQRIFVTNYSLLMSRSTDGGNTWTNLNRYAGITSTDGIAWINARRVRPAAHGMLYFDPSTSTAGGRGRLWTSEGNDGIIFADLDDATQTGDQTVSWREQSLGIEQVVGQNILLPPGNNNSALLAAEDEPTFYITNPRTFTAQRFDVDTAARGNNDLASNGMVAYVPDTPSVMVTNAANIFSAGFRGGGYRNNFASYSTNYGRNWQLFPSIQQTDGDNSYGAGSIFNIPERLVGGQIAISARGNVLPGRGLAQWTGQDNLVWLPFATQYGGVGAIDFAPHFSMDGGSSWQASTVLAENGTPVDFSTVPFQLVFSNSSKQFAVVADPVTPLTFYAVTVSYIMVTNDGGRTWRIPPGSSTALSPASYYFINAQMVAVPGRRGDLWLTTGAGSPTAGGFLFHSTDGGLSWQRLPLATTYNVSVGKGAPGRDYALYIYGRPTEAQPFGVYRSDDLGVNWSLISGNGINGYPLNNFNLPSHIAASPDVEGLVYLSFVGVGYSWGYQRSLGNPYPAQ